MPEPIAQDQQVTVEQNIAAAQSLLEKAQDRLIELSLQLDQISAKALINTEQTEDVQPKSNKLSDQNQTFDRIFSLVSQLDQKGENTETMHMRRTILMKFGDKIKRSMLKKKSSMLTEEWTTERLLLELRTTFAVTADQETIELRTALAEHADSATKKSHLDLSEIIQTAAAAVETSHECPSKSCTGSPLFQQKNCQSELGSNGTGAELDVLQNPKQRHPTHARAY
ncbi:unnamed protein product [Heligmosomoides polygyrus]|uniref:Uncharacterized protein n=1 Tax=Heligmosomoides polygyrus TaxID=6339 RepID=A0A183G254_HELPZ|nr:unnamed protein product [Heligmosomoides polygyrus]